MMNVVSVIGIVFYILSMGAMFWWQEKKIRSQYQYITLLEGMVLHLSLHRDILRFIENGEEELEEESKG
ncbi:hypothetical protein [Candidatus Nanosynbacter featherlites]|uniref:Uncharacterized protein n=1 Tax=Candidatus Nanosynbacter featherlites TaxID=2572088 RepID=A0A4P9A3C7_9BACT|nr:hypothetical protein [Candidatus Nanosynbacter featherlites]QCT42308.1 hypothetical protein FBF37_02400 [Candidatus Nanosynbacter featherlites]